MFVLVENVEGNIFGDNFVDGFGWGHHHDDVAFFGTIGGFDDFAVYFDEAFVDETLDAGAGEMGDAIDEILIDAAGGGFAEFEGEVFDVGFGVVGGDGGV